MITTPQKNDYTEIVEVWEASVRATHDFLPEESIQYFKPLILNDFLDAVKLACATNESGEILGFIGVAEGNIEMLFIAPENRGTGIGKTLLLHGLNELGASKVDVNEQNPQAIGFYEHMGFKRVGRSEEDGMGKPFPLIHMALEK